MNIQEIFDKVACHLLSQGRKAQSSSGRCMYLAHNGDTCAVGCLIPIEEYSDSYEGGPFMDIPFIKKFVFASEDPSKSSYLLKKLQEIHDQNLPEVWKSKLISLAPSFGLKLPSCFEVPPWSHS